MLRNLEWHGKKDDGNVTLVRVAEIKVYQSTKDKITTILRLLQLIVPLQFYESDSNELNSEPVNQEGNALRPQWMAAVNADLIRQLDNYWHDVRQEECEKKRL